MEKHVMLFLISFVVLPALLTLSCYFVLVQKRFTPPSSFSLLNGQMLTLFDQYLPFLATIIIS